MKSPFYIDHQSQVGNLQLNFLCKLPVTDDLCKKVISLPMHTELTDDVLSYISEAVINYFK